jgi:hypothetical protein
MMRIVSAVALAIGLMSVGVGQAHADYCHPGQDLFECVPPINQLSVADWSFVRGIQSMSSYANTDPYLIARGGYGVCLPLQSGDNVDHVVSQIFKYVGGTASAADQFLDGSMERCMPHGTNIGPDGKAHW